MSCDLVLYICANIWCKSIFIEFELGFPYASLPKVCFLGLGNDAQPLSKSQILFGALHFYAKESSAPSVMEWKMWSVWPFSGTNLFLLTGAPCIYSIRFGVIGLPPLTSGFIPWWSVSQETVRSLMFCDTDTSFYFVWFNHIWQNTLCTLNDERHETVFLCFNFNVLYVFSFLIV